ncbi:MAG: lipoyl(octanoyl) transferase LipB [Planctomycetota bacterium]
MRDLGRLAYGPAFDLQHRRNQAVIDGEAGPVVFLVEHEPVITLTRRKTMGDHLLANDAQLAQAGVATHETDRGGDITYHGPGQIVVYPVIRLGDYQLNLSRYMRLLEQTVIDSLAVWGIAGQREPGAAGVWVDAPDLAESAKPSQNALSKIAALGVRIRKNVTMHGLALNVDPDMRHFQLIVPCGLTGRSVVSMRQLLGSECPTMSRVKQVLVNSLHANLIAAATAPAPRTRAGSPAPQG